MDRAPTELPFWARMRDISLRVASNVVTFLLAPATGISIGFLIYTFGPSLTYPEDYFSFGSVLTALRSIFRVLIVFGIGVIPAAFAGFLAVSVPTIAVASFGWTIDDFRKRKFLSARIVARRESPISPRQRLHIIRPTPHELDYPVWDAILSQLPPRNLTKSVSFLRCALTPSRNIRLLLIVFNCISI
jgi:hypothetical protein